MQRIGTNNQRVFLSEIFFHHKRKTSGSLSASQIEDFVFTQNLLT